MAERMPEWMADLVRAVPDQVVKDLVKDFRSYNPHPAQDPSAKVVPQGAGKVVGGDDGVAHRPVDQSGWVDPPQISDWTPPNPKSKNRKRAGARNEDPTGLTTWTR